MPRPLAPALALCALAACVDLTPDIPPLFTCDNLGLGGMCVDAAHPVDFADDQVWLAEGGDAPLAYLALDDLAFTMSSDAPAVLAVVPGPGATFTLRGVGAGIANVVARGADGRALATLPIEVAPVAAVEFRFDPAGAAALTELAALPGATERLRLIARDARGLELVGAATVVQLATTGPLTLAPLADAELRTGRIDLFGEPPPGHEAAVRFDAVGAGTVVARVDGVDLTTLPVDVIAAATTIELRVAAAETVVDWFQRVGLVGADARGVPVAGLIGDFAASPPGLVTIVDPHAGEAALRTLAPGVVTVTATLPDRTLTARFTILPR